MKNTLAMLLGIGAFTFISCSKQDTNSTSGKTPVTIKMTDAPAYYDALMLNIDAIEVITSQGKERIDLDEHPFDILKYRMGRDTILANHDVPSGRLQEIRLILHDNGNEIVVDGEIHKLTTPSGQSSGVKLKIQDDLVPEVAYTLLLDFDASKSVHQTGNGKYMLKPVIRAVPVALSGAIQGSVSPREALPHVYAILGTDTVGTLAGPTGNFYFPGLPQGSYKVIIEPSDPQFNVKMIENVEVTTGANKDLGTIELN